MQKFIKINTSTIPVWIYCFNKINWMLDELKNTDTKVKKIHHLAQNASFKSRYRSLYIKRENSGGGFIQIEFTINTTTVGLLKYFDTIINWMVQLVNTHERQRKNMQSIKKTINLQKTSTSPQKK